MNQARVRMLVEVFYDVQGTRLAATNRVRAAVSAGLSADLAREMTDWIDLRMDRQEAELKALVMAEIKQEPLWQNWLKGVKGVGPCIAGGLMAWAGDCSNFDTVSKLWAWSGLHVLDGHAPRRERGVRANWNPVMRTLAWKASKSFVLSGRGYRALYDAEKVRLRTLHPEPEPCDPPRKRKDGGVLMRFTDGHIDAMARRKVAKVFFAHYWQMARASAGLPTREVYVIEKLGHGTVIPIVCE